MEWYSNEINVNDKLVKIIGIIEDSVLKIIVNDDVKFKKELNMWSYQEIVAEDVLAKYEGKIRKIESKIPDWVVTGRLIL